uniref:Uncharacterized protein n=1 Tax=Aegilops tauschii subsp. strangulata TaxID=200361 RepID=A0A453G0Y3_AEGTS
SPLQCHLHFKLSNYCKLIGLSFTAQEAGFFSEQENEMLSVHTCEWVQPSLNSKEKFYIKDVSS